jgi:hypothetical protein
MLLKQKNGKLSIHKAKRLFKNQGEQHDFYLHHQENHRKLDQYSIKHPYDGRACCSRNTINSSVEKN